MVIVGEKEAADGTVAMRQQGGGEQAVMSMQDFAARINKEVAEMLQAMNIRPKE
jgi:threonyl-tRNA synthetase